MWPRIPDVAKWRNDYDGRAGPMINLAPGHPAHLPVADFNAHVAEQATAPSSARYGLGEGQDALRSALQQEMADIYDASPLIDHIAITSGANQATYVAIQALAGHGDEVVVTVPFFFNNVMTLQQLGIKAVYLSCDPSDDFIPNPKDLPRLITPKTRALILTTPSNPTGSTIPSDRIEQFAALAAQHRIALILDETYRDLLPPTADSSQSDRPKPHSLFTKAAEAATGAPWPDYLVHVYSFSKSFAIPGYRLGALVASPRLIAQVLKIIDSQTICPSQIIQPAVAWALPNLKDWREEQRCAIHARTSAFVGALRQVPGWQVGASGGFYVWARHPFEGRTSAEVVKAMILQVGVSALPGSFFCPEQTGDPGIQAVADGWMRFSVPNADEATLVEAARRLQRFQL